MGGCSPAVPAHDLTEFDLFLERENGLDGYYDGMDEKEKKNPDYTRIDPLKVWKDHLKHKYPDLYFVACSHLAATEITAEPERDFSLAGLILNPLASRTDSRLVEMRLFCKRSAAFRPDSENPDPRCSEIVEGGGGSSGGEPKKRYESADGIPILPRAELASLLPGWDLQGELSAS